MKTKTKARAAAEKSQPKKEQPEAVTAPKAAEYRRERREIAVDLLKAAPWNPRGKITPESVADLVSSIKSLGVIEPLVTMAATPVREGESGQYVLISGHRRLVAAKLAGLKSVPCDVLVGVDEATARRMTFIENLQRKDADPLLESELVGSLVKSGMKQDEIAAETGRGREWVARRLNLSRLSKSWRKRVKDGEQITTDCLEHVAAYPEEVQERLKNAKTYNNPGAAIRWCDIERQFDRETQDLKKAMFDRTPCKTCPNNTGCSPDLFDWDGKPPAFGKCLDAKCYKRKVADAVKATIADAKAAGATVKESENHPDYSISLQSKPDKFQFTPVLRRATYCDSSLFGGGVSIHARLATGDLYQCKPPNRHGKFQFTPVLRRATAEKQGFLRLVAKSDRRKRQQDSIFSAQSA